jgi:hypothetical protein
MSEPKMVETNYHKIYNSGYLPNELKQSSVYFAARVYCVFLITLFQPSIIHKTVLKSIINALLEENRV